MPSVDGIAITPPDPVTTSAYVMQSLAGIDWSKPAIVLHLKGIGDKTDWERDGRPNVQPHLDSRTTALAEVHYGNVQPPLEGVWSGTQVLARVVDAIKRRKPGMRIYLSGVSLGAWTIGDTLAKLPNVRAAVEGAALFAHSATADQHYPTDTGPIREFNYPGDKFTEPHPGPHHSLVATLERLYRKIDLPNLVKSLPEIVLNPGLFQQFVTWRKGRHTPHADTDKLNPVAYAWLAGEIASRLAQDAARRA